MPIEQYEIKLFTQDDDKCPFEQWYTGIKDIATRVRIRSRLIRIRNGNFGDCKTVGKGVSELRLDFGPGFRVYFSQHEQTIVILLLGGDKSTQSNDIKIAQDMWEKYKNAPERFQRDFHK